MKMTKKMFEPLDEEEKDLIEALERDDFVPLKGKAKQKEIEFLQRAAENTIRLRQQINIRMNLHDIESLKAKSTEVGVPYQTLINTLVHQYVTGKIKIIL